jgi:hypothetical protein
VVEGSEPIPSIVSKSREPLTGVIGEKSEIFSEEVPLPIPDVQVSTDWEF